MYEATKCAIATFFCDAVLALQQNGVLLSHECTLSLPFIHHEWIEWIKCV